MDADEDIDNAGPARIVSERSIGSGFRITCSRTALISEFSFELSSASDDLRGTALEVDEPLAAHQPATRGNDVADGVAS